MAISVSGSEGRLHLESQRSPAAAFGRADRHHIESVVGPALGHSPGPASGRPLICRNIAAGDLGLPKLLGD
jgi:hypothetical protein